MAPTGAVEVPQLSFNELICQLVAAHEHEIVDLQTEIKQLRDSKDDASSGEISVSGSGSGPLELSTFSSRQPTLAGTEEYEPLPEDTEACLPPLEKSEELPRPPCLTQRHQVRPDSAPNSVRKRSGPDAKALACALQVAQNLGAISEDHVHGFEIEADLLYSESATSSHEGDSISITPEVSAGAPGRPESEVSPDSGGAAAPTRYKGSLRATEPPSSLARSKVTPIKKSFLPASPLDDYEPIPEEDKSCIQSDSSNIDLQVEASSIKSAMNTSCHGSSSSASASTDDQPKSPEVSPDGKVLVAPREWSIFSEMTGEAVSTVNRTLDTSLGLTSGIGLHTTSAIWIEASDHGRHRQPSKGSRSDIDSLAHPWSQPCRITDAHEGDFNDSSHLQVSRRDNQELEDFTPEGIELSKLDEIEINRDSELGANEVGRLDMRCEKFPRNATAERAQTLVVSRPTVNI